jgi:hypothetical protein
MRLTAALIVAMVGTLAEARGARADALADALAPHVGGTLDLVELGTGRRFVRPGLVGVNEKEGAVAALRIRADGRQQVTTVPLAGIVKIVAGRETIHEAEVRARGPSQARGKRAREVYAKQVTESEARMRARGVEPWPELSAAEHAAAVSELGEFVARVRQAFPALAVVETHEFIVATDIPAAQMAPSTAKLDAMHDLLCDLYGIPQGEPVWQGKCLVVAFLAADDFRAFEGRFMEVDATGIHGLCHQRSDGRVVMACHRGDDAPAFGHMLVHETSHGFNHRWISPERLPNWLNEGIAEWVGTQVVPACRQVPLKEARALEVMRARRSLGDGFFDPAPDFHIQADQYGIASSLVRFMVARDRKKFAAFVQGIKEGLDVETSLKESFRASLADLVQAYGKAIGVPDLTP